MPAILPTARASLHRTPPPCDDGNACTTGDVCADGVCGGAPLLCNDDNVCTTDTCNPATGCQFTPNPGQTCDADTNACTLDECDIAGSCQFVSNAPAGAACDDGLFCNGSDTCDGAGTCEHSGDPCAGGSECNETCNEAADNCFDPAGTPCSEDGLVCTADECDGAGACAHTALPVAKCPKGYVLLEAPSSATVEATVGQSSVADGSSCTTRLDTRREAILPGDAIADASSGTGIQLRQSVQVAQQCITAGSSVVLSGIPPGTCTGPVDTTGTHAKLADCGQAADKADVRRTSLLALPAGLTFGNVTVSSNQILDVTALGALAVVDYNSLTVGHSKTLTIKGNAGTQAVLVRVSNNFLVRGFGKVLTQGIANGPNGSPAERVLFLVGGEARLRTNSETHGSVFATGRVRLGMDAKALGALVSQNGPISTHRTSQLTHAPWVLW